MLCVVSYGVLLQEGSNFDPSRVMISQTCWHGHHVTQTLSPYGIHVRQLSLSIVFLKVACEKHGMLHVLSLAAQHGNESIAGAHS